MKYTQGEIILKMITNLSEGKTECKKQKFFEQEIKNVISRADYLELSQEDIEYLKNAKLEK